MENCKLQISDSILDSCILPNSFILSLYREEPIIIIDKEGFKYKGRLIEDSGEVFELFKKFLSGATSSQTEISEPNPQLIESMCYRYRHDFGFLKDNHKESIRTTMKQLWEEVVGKGFYKQKEISDEEIDDVAERYAMDNFSVKAAVKFGIKWYREQLKKKNL